MKTFTYNSNRFRVTDAHCFERASGYSPEESTKYYEIVFPRRGLFLARISGRERVADAHSILFFNQEEPYQIAHPIDGGDQCTIFAFPRPAILEILHNYAAGETHSRSLFRFTHCLSSSRAYFLHLRLLAWLRKGPVNDLEFEDRLFELMDQVLPSALEQNGAGAGRLRFQPSSVHRERAMAVRRILAERYSEAITLPDLAREVCTTPAHLSRTFRREIGIPVYRYLRRLRLRLALERLAGGEKSITDLALDLGFFDHSHFTNAFQQEFGTSPSAFRRLAVRKQREVGRRMTSGTEL